MQLTSEELRTFALNYESYLTFESHISTNQLETNRFVFCMFPPSHYDYWTNSYSVAQTRESQIGRKRDVNNLYQVIYYGDSQVEVGEPFSISCIISIADPVEWHKDGEPIRKHSQIRHGKDEHSYIESEIGIAGKQTNGGWKWDFISLVTVV